MGALANVMLPVRLYKFVLQADGLAVKLKLIPTFIEAVAVPQVPTAVTEIVPTLAPKLTVMAFEFVGAEVILAPAGNDQV